jgi:hypothetical protein
VGPHITCQTILIPTASMRAVEEGILIFADDVLMAVVMRLDSSVDDEGMRGLW